MVEFELLPDDTPVTPKSMRTQTGVPGVDAQPTSSSVEATDLTKEPIVDIEGKSLDLALKAKEEGNEYFRTKDYDLAIELYSQAILLCPVDASEKEVESKSLGETKASAISSDMPYKPPSKNAEMLSIFLSNRAACFAALGEWDMVIDDCNWARDLNTLHVKALMRRSQAYEKLDKIEDALADARRVQEIDPTWPTIGSIVSRLQAQHNKKMEELKAEALDKLKDLGNSILGNFGMSLDNFKFEQDPKTGAWSMGTTNK
jgi:tetratricopeptide (TPR) repeat protein